MTSKLTTEAAYRNLPSHSHLLRVALSLRLVFSRPVLQPFSSSLLRSPNQQLLLFTYEVFSRCGLSPIYFYCFLISPITYVDRLWSFLYPILPLDILTFTFLTEPTRFFFGLSPSSPPPLLSTPLFPAFKALLVRARGLSSYPTVHACMKCSRSPRTERRVLMWLQMFAVEKIGSIRSGKRSWRRLQRSAQG